MKCDICSIKGQSIWPSIQVSSPYVTSQRENKATQMAPRHLMSQEAAPTEEWETENLNVQKTVAISDAVETGTMVIKFNKCLGYYITFKSQNIQYPKQILCGFFCFFTNKYKFLLCYICFCGIFSQIRRKNVSHGQNLLTKRFTEDVKDYIFFLFTL